MTKKAIESFWGAYAFFKPVPPSPPRRGPRIERPIGRNGAMRDDSVETRRETSEDNPSGLTAIAGTGALFVSQLMHMQQQCILEGFLVLLIPVVTLAENKRGVSSIFKCAGLGGTSS